MYLLGILICLMFLIQKCCKHFACVLQILKCQRSAVVITVIDWCSFLIFFFFFFFEIRILILMYADLPQEMEM